MAWYEGAVQSKFFLNKIEELIANHPTEWEVVGHHNLDATSGDSVGVIFRPVNTVDQSYMTYGISKPYITNNYISSSSSPCVCLNVSQFREYVPDEDTSQLGTFSNSWLRNLNISPRGRSSSYVDEFLSWTSPVRYMISIKSGHISMFLAHTNGTGDILYGYVHFGKLIDSTSNDYVDAATIYTNFYTRFKAVTGVSLDASASMKCYVQSKDEYYDCFLVNHSPSFKFNKGTTQIAFDHFISRQSLNVNIGRLPIKSLQFTRGIVDKDLLDLGGVEYVTKLLNSSSLGTTYSYYGFLSQNALYAIEKS